MVAFLVVSLALTLPAPQSDRVPAKRGEHDVVVRGCLSGPTLKRARTETGGSTEDFRLRLPKAIAKALKEYQGHDMELTGVLKDDDRTMEGGKTAKVGERTKITIGVREDRSVAVPQPRELQVTGFRDIAPACAR